MRPRASGARETGDRYGSAPPSGAAREQPLRPQAAADIKAGKRDTDAWDGFLSRSPNWQSKSSHGLADYFCRELS
jgi:hypothetical protein